MMDYVKLIEYVKKTGGYDNVTTADNLMTPVYVFGSAYSGMIATWLRIKYPTHFHGVVASGAPILGFKGGSDPNSFSKIASQVLKDEYGEECYQWQQQGFYDLIQAQQI